MITLWPRLPEPAAERLLDMYLNSANPWGGFDAYNLPEAVRFSSTGGSPITSADMMVVRTEIMTIAARNGFGRKATRGEHSSFDSQTAAWLTDQRLLDSGEAFRNDVWAFIAIVLLPDVTAWRFDKSPERYHGGVRNTFQRLWLRGKLFDKGKLSTDRWTLLDELTEDAFLQIVERPSISGSPALALAIAEAWIRASIHHGKSSMELLTRRAITKIRAWNEVRCLDELPPQELANTLDNVFETPTATVRDQDPAKEDISELHNLDTEMSALVETSSARLVAAAGKLREAAQRWGLLSPESTFSIESLLFDTELTISEKNALTHLLDRVETIGLIEAEIEILRTLVR